MYILRAGRAQTVAEVRPPTRGRSPRPPHAPADEAEAPGFGVEQVKHEDAVPDPEFLVREVEELEERIEGLKKNYG